MHGNHHHHHQRTDLGGIMSITSVFTIGPFVPCMACTPLQNLKYASDVNMPSQTKWRNVGWKRSTFLFNVYKRFFFIFVTFLRFLVFFLERFLHLCRQQSESTQVSGPQVERIKGCLGGGLRSSSVSLLTLFFMTSNVDGNRRRDARKTCLWNLNV